MKALLNNQIINLNEIESSFLSFVTLEQRVLFDGKWYFNPDGAIIIPNIPDKPSKWHTWSNNTWEIDLSKAKEEILESFRIFPQEYIYSKYDSGTQLSLLNLKMFGTESQKLLCNQVSDWIASVLIDYYSRRYQIMNAVTLEEINSVSSDFSNNDATKPDIELSTVLSAG